MSDTLPPLPADEKSVLFDLTFALRFRRHSRPLNHTRMSDEMLAAHIYEHLIRSGYVLLRKQAKPNGPAP